LIPQKQFVKWPESFSLVDSYASWNPVSDHCAVVTIASLMVPAALVGMTLKILLDKPILTSSDQQVLTRFSFPLHGSKQSWRKAIHQVT
jgi:hypothetical protein